MSGVVYPQVSAEEWAKRYKIDIRAQRCVGCGKKFIADIPWASKHYRGFQAKLHECGEEFQLTTGVPVDPDERAEWINLAKTAERRGNYDK